MRIYNNGILSSNYSNNTNYNVSQNKVQNKNKVPTFGYFYKENCHPVSFEVAGISALILVLGTIITPGVVYKTLHDKDKKQIELNTEKGDSLIANYKSKLEKEKEILTLTNYPTDEFMETLKNIGDGKDGITYQDGKTYKNSDNIPLFVNKMWKYEREIYNNLPPEKREFLNSIKRNIQLNANKNSDDFKINHNVPNSVEVGSLAVVDTLLLLSELGNRIESKASQKLYNNLIFEIANRYVNQSLKEDSLNEKLQNIRDKIANNMTIQEQQAYEAEYSQKLEEFKQQIEEQVKESNKKHDSAFAFLRRVILSACSMGAVLFFGIPIWLMIIAALDSDYDS